METESGSVLAQFAMVLPRDNGDRKRKCSGPVCDGMEGGSPFVEAGSVCGGGVRLWRRGPFVEAGSVCGGGVRLWRGVSFAGWGGGGGGSV